MRQGKDDYILTIFWISIWIPDSVPLTQFNVFILAIKKDEGGHVSWRTVQSSGGMVHGQWPIVHHFP